MKPYDTAPDRFDPTKTGAADAARLAAMAGLNKSQFRTVAETQVPTNSVAANRRTLRLAALEAVGLGGY
jgi:hypothetical protein